MSTPKPSEMPFHVRVVGSGGLHSGYSDLDGATAGARAANTEAEKMGLVARYETVPKP